MQNVQAASILRYVLTLKPTTPNCLKSIMQSMNYQESRKSFIGSGVRYDLLLHKSKDEKSNEAARQYTRELITRHVSGRLKVAPEHTSEPRSKSDA